MANADGSIILDTGLDTSGFDAGSQKMIAAANRMTQQITSQGKNLQQNLYSIVRSAASLGNTLSHLSDTASLGFTNEKQLDRFALNLDNAKEKLAGIQAEMARVAQQQTPSEEYSQLSKMLEQAELRLSQLNQRMEMAKTLGVDTSTDSYKRLAMQVQAAKADVSALMSDMQAMRDSGTAFVSGDKSSTYQALQKQLEAYKAAISSLSSTEASERQQLQENTTARQQAAAAASEAKAQQASEAAAARKASEDHKQAEKHARAFANALKAVAHGASRIPGAVSSMVSGLKKFLGISAKSTDSTKDLVKGLTGLSRMLKSRIKRMFISDLFRQIGASMKSLARYSATFNATMSSMKNSMKTLSGNVAVTASGIVNAFGPAIATMIDWLSTAISYLNAFFALLSGKSSVTVAKKATDDYAKSLKGAGGAAKDLKNQVYGFDSLNKEQDSGGGGGGGSGVSGAEYEDVAIGSLLPESLMNLFEQIKMAFTAGEWEQVGSLVSTGLNSIVVSVDSWITGTLEPATVTWAANIARGLNGMVSGLDWYFLGVTFADGLNVITRTVNSFVRTFNWVELGRGLAAKANGLVSGIDWNELGTALASKAHVVWSVLYGFVTKFDWATLGSNLATGANSMFGSINWTQVATTVAAGLYGVWTTIWTTVAEFDWTGLGTTLADAINTLFDSEEGPIDWVAAAQMMSDGLIQIIDGITTFLEGVNWQQIGSDVAAFISSIDWSGLVSSLCEGIGAAVGGLAALLWGLIKEPWDQVVAWWNELAFGDGEQAILGLLNGITAGLANIGSWIVTNIFDPIINGFKAAFGIHSPSTVMAEQGGYLVSGLLQGLTDAWSDITTFFSTSVENIKTALSTAWESIKTTAFTAWNGIKTTITDSWDSLYSSISSGWEDLKTGLSGAWDSVTTTASSAWEGVKNTVVGWWDSLVGAVKGEDWESVGKGVVDGTETGITSNWSTFKSRVTGWFGGLVSSVKNSLGIHSPSTVFAEIGDYCMQGLNVGLEAEQSTVERTVSDIASSLSDGMQISPTESIGMTLSDGIDVAADKLSGVASIFAAIADSITAIGSIAIPDIARGSVIPYSARIGESDHGSSAQAAEMSQFVSNFDDTMTDQRDVLMDILNAIRGLDLTVDGNSLTRAITSIQRSQARAFGGV